MITIKEDLSKKLSGITSLFLSFKYNLDIISCIKQNSKYSFDVATKMWEVPCTSLSVLLDELTYIDDITLQLYVDNTIKESFYPKCTYKTKPFAHQMEAIKYGLSHDQWLLLDEPGLGKSLSVIDLALELKEQKGLQRCLIICGINSLKQNWKKEIKTHSDLTYRIPGESMTKSGKLKYGSTADRAAEIKQGIDAFFTIINVEMLRNDDVVKALQKTKKPYDMIIVDEIHKCSNKKSQQASGLLKLKAKYKIGLTGTLLTNTPLNAYLPLNWIGVEKTNLTNFKSQYCIYGGFGGHEIVGYQNIETLKQIIDNCSLRRTKDMLKDLPPKTIIKEYVEMNDQDARFYEGITKGVLEEAKIELHTNKVLALTTRLRQATVSPNTLTSEKITCSKIERCKELVDDIISHGDKVVIMSTFKDPVYVLEKELKEYNPLIGTGDLDDAVVSNNIDLFQNDPKYKVIIVTSAKCGTGITLNAARYMIMLDTPWTYALTEQCEDRIHRVTNTQPVFIYRLIDVGTVDEVVDKIVDTKQAMSDYIVDDKLSESSVTILRDYLLDLK